MGVGATLAQAALLCAQPSWPGRFLHFGALDGFLVVLPASGADLHGMPQAVFLVYCGLGTGHWGGGHKKVTGHIPKMANTSIIFKALRRSRLGPVTARTNPVGMMEEFTETKRKEKMEVEVREK